MSVRSESPGCLVEQAVNAAMKDAYRDAGQLLLDRFAKTTLASLTVEFKQRYKERRSL